MRYRILIIFSFLLALTWIIFISFSLIRKDITPNYRDYFNSKDQQIVVIHNSKEVNWEVENFQILSENKAVFFSIIPKIKGEHSFFLSSKRKMILIERSEKWLKKDVISIFSNGLYPLKFTSSIEFNYGKYIGKLSNNQLLLYQGELTSPKHLDFELDSKASFSLINFFSNDLQVSDFYNKPNGSYRYTKSKFHNSSIYSLDDKKLFSGILPLNFSNYSFYSSSYLNEIDSEYNKSHFQKCVDKGLVFIEDSGRAAAFFYIKDGQNPIQHLNEKLNLEELNENSAVFKNIYFSSYIKQDPSVGLFIEQFTDFAIVTNNKSYLDELVSAINLGESLSQNKEKVDFVYKDLPSKVSTRVATPNSRKTISVYEKSSIETEYIPLNRIKFDPKNKDTDYFTMNLGERIKDFIALDERGNVIILTESNKLVGFIDGLRKWEKQLTNNNVVIKDYPSNQNFFSLIADNECQVFDKNGRLINRLMSSNGIVPCNYTTKKNEFLAVNAATNFAVFNEEGTIIKQFSTTGNIKQIGKYSNGENLELAILTTDMIYTLNPTNRLITKKITCDSSFQLYSDNSSIAYAGIKNNTLQIINYTGALQSIRVSATSKIVGHYFEDKNLVLLVKIENSLMAINQNGIKKWNIKLPTTEITSCSVRKAKNGINLIGILDAIENKIYLLNTNGQKIDDNQCQGSGKIQVTRFGENTFSISSILGNSVIQYSKQ